MNWTYWLIKEKGLFSVWEIFYEKEGDKVEYEYCSVILDLKLGSIEDTINALEKN